MITVFSNSMVAHVWAQRTQDHGRNSSSSFRFVGATLWSYQTPVAHIVDGATAPVVLISENRHSSTTGKQLSDAEQATRHLKRFYVPALSVHSGDWHREPNDQWGAHEPAMLANAHSANVAHFMSEYATRERKLQRSPSDYTEAEVRSALNCEAQDCADYCEAFAIPCPVFLVEADVQRIMKRRNSPARAKRRAEREVRERNARERRELAERVRRAREAEAMAQYRDVWTAHGEIPSEFRYLRLSDANGNALIRLSSDGQYVETSWGANGIDLDAAKLMLRAHFAGRDLVGQRIGSFTVRTQFAMGADLQIGCHDFSRSELERFAKSVGVDVQS